MYKVKQLAWKKDPMDELKNKVLTVPEDWASYERAKAELQVRLADGSITLEVTPIETCSDCGEFIGIDCECEPSVAETGESE